MAGPGPSSSRIPPTAQGPRLTAVPPDCEEPGEQAWRSHRRWSLRQRVHVNGHRPTHPCPQRGNAAAFLTCPKKSIPSTTYSLRCPSSFQPAPRRRPHHLRHQRWQEFPQQSQIRRSCPSICSPTPSPSTEPMSGFRLCGHWLPRPLQAAPPASQKMFCLATPSPYRWRIDHELSEKRPSRTPSSDHRSVRSATTLIYDSHQTHHQRQVPCDRRAPRRPARVPDRCQAGLLSNRIRTIAALIGAHPHRRQPHSSCAFAGILSIALSRQTSSTPPPAPRGACFRTALRNHG